MPWKEASVSSSGGRERQCAYLQARATRRLLGGGLKPSKPLGGGAEPPEAFVDVLILPDAFGCYRFWRVIARAQVACKPATHAGSKRPRVPVSATQIFAAGQRQARLSFGSRRLQIIDGVVVSVVGGRFGEACRKGLKRLAKSRGPKEPRIR